MDQTTLIIFGVAFLAAVCIGAVGFAFVGSKSDKSNVRMARVARGPARAASADEKEKNQGDNAGQRRKQVQPTLKEIEAKQKAEKEKLTIRLRLQRAGLEITPKTFYIASACFGLVVAVGVALSGLPLGAAALGGFAGGFGFPRWFVNFKTKRRQSAFVEEFANSLDVIVRGVKAGLPINDCLKIIANESPEPVGSEFRELVDGQAMGVTVEQGLQRVYERMPRSEEHTSELQSRSDLVCRLLLEKKKKKKKAGYGIKRFTGCVGSGVCGCLTPTLNINCIMI